jgi:predicted ATPase/class 3 adenylate cyclase
MTPTLPSGTVTFLFTDIEGSTPLWERDPAAMQAAVAQHHAIVRGAIDAQGGQVFQIVGDAFQAAFPLAAPAVQAAVAAQRQLAAARWGATGPLRVRMGLYTGPAEPGGADYGYGTSHTLNRVARVMSAAHGGQVLLGAATAELVHGRLAPGLYLKDLGQHRLKGLPQPQQLFQVIVPELPQNFPPLATQTPVSHNLPRPLTAFIGRERELALVQQALGQARLVTLTGPGGVGKTRLAMNAAAEALGAFRDGVWLVELAPVVDPARLVPTLAGVLDLREAPGLSLADQVADYLRAKQTLLILDNCEHLVADCAQLADQLLHACPALTLLASSREGLGIAGETVIPVPPLALPEAADASLDALARCEAVRLFVARAAAVQPRFALTERNAPAITQICRRLDGIPLALELAAARCAVFTPEQIAARLDDRFRLLAGGSRTALPRHQTLRALVDFSYDLLTEPERALLRRCAVFSGGWTLEAAEAVNPALDVLTWLPQLVNKSLVLADAGGAASAVGPAAAGEPRYRLLETIRQYAQEKLAAAGEADSARQQHAHYYLHYAVLANKEFLGPEALGWLQRLEAEHDNLRAALAWAVASEPETALRLADACSQLWSWHSYETEARSWCQAALAAADRLPAAERLPPVEGEAGRARASARAGALATMAWAAITQGDHRAGRAAAAEAARLAREIGDPIQLSRSLNSLALALFFLNEPETALATALESVAISRQTGNKLALAMALSAVGWPTLWVQHDLAQAQAYYDESMALAREVGFPVASVLTIYRVAAAASQRGDLATARQKFQEAAALFRSLGNRRMAMASLSELAHGLRRHGQLEEAVALYRESLAGWQELGHRAAVAHELECLAFIAVAQGQTQRAARLFGAAETLRAMIDTPMTAEERAEYDLSLARLREQLDAATFTSALAEGRTLNLEQAIAYALE